MDEYPEISGAGVPFPADPSCVRCGCPRSAHHKLHCEGRLGECRCSGGFEGNPGYVPTAVDKVFQDQNSDWDAEHRAAPVPQPEQDAPIWYGPDLVADAGLEHVDPATRSEAFEAFDKARQGAERDQDGTERCARCSSELGAAPVPQPAPPPVPGSVHEDLTARLAAADQGWAHEHGDPPANPEYIQRLAFQVMAFQPPLVAGVYVDEDTHDDMRERLHDSSCGCGEWDSHSQEYVAAMDSTIEDVLWPLRPAAAPVPQGTQAPDTVISMGELYDIASAVHQDNRHDGRSVAGMAWRDAAWLVYGRANAAARVHPDTAEAERLQRKIDMGTAEVIALTKQARRVIRNGELLLWLHAEAAWQRDELVSIVADLADDSPCDHIDHHGHCQTHGWLYDSPCPQNRIKDYATRAAQADGGAP